ncbi:uncharacterized protein LOC132902161 [Amyelois transitella]|uniref:uncharacterized protein LOC132902161 n=1 Tax=Amyelois transitella TaxID=680683 RepID=UPI00298FD426|nr:uncharacterized protein LOC132902161 [Amyelois transitella]
MPVTRSQKGKMEPLRPPTTTSEETGTTHRTPTSRGTTSGTEDSTNTSMQTGTREQALPGSTMTLVPMEPRDSEPTQTTRSPSRSKRAGTSKSVKTRRKLQLEKEIAELKLEQIKAETAKREAEAKLLEEESDSDLEEPEDRADRVRSWMAGTQDNASCMEVPFNRNEDLPVNNLASAIAAAFEKATSKHKPLPPKYMFELPTFNGDSAEWLAFLTVYTETSTMFSAVQNMARLRKSIVGQAREAVKNILYSDSQPNDVMEALRRRFGRADLLVTAELDKLRALPRVSENVQELSAFSCKVNNSVTSIKGLKKNKYLHSPEIVKQITEKLPAFIQFRWCDYIAQYDEDEPDLEILANFLNKEADRSVVLLSNEKKKVIQPKRQSAHVAVEQPMRRGIQCIQCKGDHYFSECKELKNASIDERWEMVKKLKVCFNCLRGRHRKDDCRSRPCRQCKRLHHALLHKEYKKENSTYEKKKEEAGVTGTVNTLKTPQALLKIMPVQLYGPTKSVKVLALLDEGSTVTLLDEATAKEIGATGPKEILALETVGGNTIRNTDSERINLKIKGVHQRKKMNINNVRTIKEIQLSPQTVDRARLEACPHLKPLIDKICYEDTPPKMLIGQDNWELIVSRHTRKRKKDEPVASFTKLGWVLHGCDGGITKQVQFMRCAHLKSQDDNLDAIIKEHFAIEALGVTERKPSSDIEERATKKLEEVVRKVAVDKYEAGLIWKAEDETLPDNRSTAESRMRNLEKKLDKDPELKADYEKQIQHLLDSDYAEEAPKYSTSTRLWYLPHFAVTHPTKKKRRIVFDAAARSNGKCLNDALLSGPDLLQSLWGVLIRFRQGPIAVVADIKEMFLQILMREDDRDSLRFLWRGGDRTGPMKEYRLKTVIFGAASSPSTAIFVKNKNAKDNGQGHQEAIKAIEKNHYMDDYLQSFWEEEHAVEVATTVDEIHKKASFHLRGWASNRPNVLKRINGDNSLEKELELGQQEEKTLGMKWKVQEDCFSFRVAMRNVPREILRGEKTPTKRQVVSAIMSTFDPLGLIAPVLIQGKKLMQNIWRSGVGWDTEILASEEDEWRKYLQHMKTIEELTIPRCISPHHTEGELHVFTDASETSYAASAYWKTIEEDAKTSLIAAKNRVTPLKPISVPRLELQAALLGCRLARAIEKEMDLTVVKKTFWTDSTTVLSWIKSDPRTFKTFVAHRLAEIEELSKPQDWRWVPTNQNPADDATRDVPENFNERHRWFEGPEFLKQSEEHWPKPKEIKREPHEEDKKIEKVATTRQKEFSTPDPKRFSSWNRLLRSTARVVQFIEILRNNKQEKEKVNATKKDEPWRKNRKRKKTPIVLKKISKEQQKLFIPLETHQLAKAEALLMRRSQDESFKAEIDTLRKGQHLTKSQKLHNLDIVEIDGILRLKGRINAVEGTQQEKNPIVLDKRDWITRLLIQHYHNVFHHGNHATVINELRQRYWIVGIRAAVRSIAHLCQWCKVRKSMPTTIPMGDLPPERLSHNSHPFTCTAVDYFGPMTITIGRRHEKRWGALFTCLTTRAVHVELATSLSTDSMIMALRRFAARRGMPKVIYSDNGTNFVGANRELKEAVEALKKEEVEAAADNIGVRWKFIPPGAPNMGGAWERLVRSVKTSLTAVLKEKNPSEETLHTLLLEVEHIINSRPLTELEDCTNPESLTPNHFLIGRSCGAPRLGAFSDSDLVGKPSWKTSQRLADHFWSRWLKEYLPGLLPRRNVGQPTRDIRCGDIVAVLDPALPRGTWPRGRVVRTLPGPDDRTRVVDVATGGGILRRPASKLVVIVPVNSENKAEQK